MAETHGTRGRGWVAASLVATACAFNPATGRLQLTTLSESQEIALGREHDAEVTEALGEYEDARWQSSVRELGQSLAAQSERPGLPWTFRVLDDPAVNAFALPGGFVYVTRGLLAHMRSDDELAAVLGHEIGHVTARHGVVQLRKSRVAAASVGLFRIVDPNLRHVGGLAASTAGLALLKYSRDDEYEADGLGLRYVERAGYEPAATVAVFDVLVAVSGTGASQKVPTWLSTHPDPELRQERVRTLVKGKGEVPGPVDGIDAQYVGRLDGMVFGVDPRNGFVQGNTYAHPRLGYGLQLPEGWTSSRQGAQVLAVSPDEQALMLLTPTEAESAAAAIDAFFADGSIERGESWDGQVGGFAVRSAGFSVASDEGALLGLVAFIDYDDRVLALAAFGPQEGWAARSDEVAKAFASFGRVDAAVRDIDPMRVRPWTLERTMTLIDVQAERPSVIELHRLAVLNGIAPTESLPQGTAVKRVEGFNPEASSTLSKPPAVDSPD